MKENKYEFLRGITETFPIKEEVASPQKKAH